MPLQATSGAASYDAFGGGVPVVPNYIEDVFSTYLYTGNATTGQSINNGIDLATKGGLLWCKNRTTASTPHYLFDTARDFSYTNAAVLNSASTAAQEDKGTDYAKPETNGFSFGSGAGTTSPNKNGDAFVSWTFRKQPKFFDVVTYTGNGAIRNIAHNLGSVPGFIIVKRLDTARSWAVYHRSLGANKYLNLNATTGVNAGDYDGYWNLTEPTSTVFTVRTDGDVNTNGGSYVAYLFAHDAGGFGLTGTDNVISCGSFTQSIGGFVNLGFEPQWVLTKRTSNVDDWRLFDNMRGMTMGDDSLLNPNLSAAENNSAGNNYLNPQPTGFTTIGFDSGTHIYIAIRRGPMKVPTSGTSVFSPVTSSASTGTTLTTDFPIDLQILKSREAVDNNYVADRLRGVNTTGVTGTGGPFLVTNTTAAEVSNTNLAITNGWNNTSFKMPGGFGTLSSAFWNFRRAPSFFDVVCYTGTGSATTFSHNLAAVPELIIFKRRSTVNPWMVYCNRYNGGVNANQYYQVLNATDSENSGSGLLNNTDPTSSVFTVGTWNENNASGSTYVAYLFATCVGVSKVGSYTGNGSTQTIDCGFGAGGARFVLIKRANSTGGWYVYDTARGMTTLTDPYLLLNDTAAESATLGSVTTVSTGFALNSTILAAINVSGGTYIFLAIA